MASHAIGNNALKPPRRPLRSLLSSFASLFVILLIFGLSALTVFVLHDFREHFSSVHKEIQRSAGQQDDPNTDGRVGQVLANRNSKETSQAFPSFTELEKKQDTTISKLDISLDDSRQLKSLVQKLDGSLRSPANPPKIAISDADLNRLNQAANNGAKDGINDNIANLLSEWQQLKQELNWLQLTQRRRAGRDCCIALICGHTDPDATHVLKQLKPLLITPRPELRSRRFHTGVWLTYNNKPVPLIPWLERNPDQITKLLGTVKSGNAQDAEQTDIDSMQIFDPGTLGQQEGEQRPVFACVWIVRRATTMPPAPRRDRAGDGWKGIAVDVIRFLPPEQSREDRENFKANGGVAHPAEEWSTFCAQHDGVAITLPAPNRDGEDSPESRDAFHKVMLGILSARFELLSARSDAVNPAGKP